MTTLTRAGAQDRVVRSAARLSDELLVVEQGVQAACAREFAARVPPVRPRTVTAFRTRAATRNALLAEHHRAVAAVSDRIEVMLREVGAAAAASIERELRHIERALPAKHRGRTVTTMTRVDPSVVVARALVLRDTATAALDVRFAASVRDAATRAKTVEQIHDRLVGRGRPQGAWWATSTALQTQVRSLSIATANAVRQTAMGEFNRDDV